MGRLDDDVNPKLINVFFSANKWNMRLSALVVLIATIDLPGYATTFSLESAVDQQNTTDMAIKMPLPVALHSPQRLRTHKVFIPAMKPRNQRNNLTMR
ncbi:unnamed protein product [Clavelina lepadiformis]|uniref:Uncharacterized protein n=1 Tax=Clavelina lepadiformis TaxID=159417 RepID=A0ABP0G0D9_CLALP